MTSPVYEALSPDGRTALAEEARRLEERLHALNLERVERERLLEETIVQIGNCDSALRTLSGLLGIEHGANASVASANRSEQPRTAGDSIVEAITDAFTERGNAALHYRDLAELLVARGVTLGGKDAAGTLLAILTNARYCERFKRCGRGTYMLADATSAGNVSPKPTKLRKTRRRRRARRVAK